jgi:diaminopimelate epimerase
MKYEIYSGAGNDFVMINNFEGIVPFEKQAARAAEICAERFRNIDGVIFADKPKHYGSAIRMNYYNRDGSFGAMCGNGARCIAMFAHKHNIVSENKFILEAVSDLYTAEICDETNVKLTFPAPKKVRTDIVITAELNRELRDMYLSYVNVGSDHIVLFVDEEKNKAALNNTLLQDIEINSAGRTLRYHSEFQPAGANVNFVQPLSKHKIKLRTYERGVERETLACGTGIVSSAIISVLKGIAEAPVQVEVQSGEWLTVNFESEGGTITNLSLTGSARKISEGEI